MSSPVGDLPCRELVELVTEYLEDRLPPEDRARFDAHVGLCDGCRTYLDQMRQVLRAAGKLSEEALEPEARDTLLSAFRQWKGTPGRRGP
jgi:anti-sigma factor RsiW